MTIDNFCQNPHNPYTYSEDDMQDLITKIIRRPKFMTLRPMVYDPDPKNNYDDKFIFLGGNKRFAACQRLATWTDAQMDQLRKLNPDTDYAWLETLRTGQFPDGWIEPAADMTDEEKRDFVFADNKTYGEMDFEFVTEEEAEDWGFEWEAVQPPPNYSSKNKELNPNDFSDLMEMKFKFTEHQFKTVLASLSDIAETKEQALLNLLEIE